MSQPNSNAAPDKAKEPTAADAAKKVRRMVVEQIDGKDKVRKVAVDPAEVLSFADHGTHIVVVTADGQKLSSLDA